MNFTIYYFKPEKAKKFEDLYILDKVGNGFIRLEAKNYEQLDFDYQGFLQSEKANPPVWLSFVSPYFVIEKIKNTSNSLILLIRIVDYGKQHYFAIVGGNGHFYLNKELLQRDFGLKVALNTLDPNRISIFDSKTISVNQKQQRITYAKGNPIQEFQFDENEDFLNQLAGKPADKNFATRLSGSESLHVYLNIDFSEIGKKCKFLLQKYRSKDYQEVYPFYDNLKAIEDEVLITALNLELTKYIGSGAVDCISLSLPTMDDYPSTNEYSFVVGTHDVQENDLAIENIYELIKLDKPPSITIDYLNNFSVFTLDTTGSHQNHFSLLGILNFELQSYKGQNYIYNHGKWYRINKSYVEKIEKEFNKIEVIQTTNYMPSMNSGESEGSYNARLSSVNYCIYDKDLFPVPKSRSSVEVCDAYYEQDKHLICVKKLRGSASLSHLFAQGSVSVQLLSTYDKYRKFFCERTNKHFKSKNYSFKTLNIEDYKLVYAIATKRKGTLDKLIPFFSKINLITHLRTCKIVGIKVALYKIE